MTTDTTTKTAPFLDVNGLGVSFGKVRAVDNVSFSVNRGEIVGLVGESGSGKTTIGRSILRLIEPDAGKVFLDGSEVTALSGGELGRARRKMQMVFQDPFASLSPRFTVGQIVSEGLRIQGIGNAKERRAKAEAMLVRVGLPAEAAERYPHEFSGGQRQRIGIARALVMEPSLVIADEPVSALDVSVQAQILNLLADLREDLGLTMLFISHDLAVVEFICERVVVLYLGRIMEYGPGSELCADPLHPYTKALLSAVPTTEPGSHSHRILLEGDIPNPASPPPGCVFATRCPWAIKECSQARPQLREIKPNRWTACIRDF